MREAYRREVQARERSRAGRARRRSSPTPAPSAPVGPRRVLDRARRGRSTACPIPPSTMSPAKMNSRTLRNRTHGRVWLSRSTVRAVTPAPLYDPPPPYGRTRPARMTAPARRIAAGAARRRARRRATASAPTGRAREQPGMFDAGIQSDSPSRQTMPSASAARRGQPLQLVRPDGTHLVRVDRVIPLCCVMAVFPVERKCHVPACHYGSPESLSRTGDSCSRRAARRSAQTASKLAGHGGHRPSTRLS